MLPPTDVWSQRSARILHPAIPAARLSFVHRVAAQRVMTSPVVVCRSPAPGYRALRSGEQRQCRGRHGSIAHGVGQRAMHGMTNGRSGRTRADQTVRSLRPSRHRQPGGRRLSRSGTGMERFRRPNVETVLAGSGGAHNVACAPLPSDMATTARDRPVIAAVVGSPEAALETPRSRLR
jgi:hypothetical protein